MVSKGKLLILLSIQLFSLISAEEKKTLVLLDDWHNIDLYSTFWNQIRAMGYEVVFKMVTENNIKFINYGEYLYSNIIYFAPTFDDLKSKNEITIANLLKFVDDGHDLMIFGSADSGQFVRNLVNEFGVDFDDYDSTVKDSIYLHSKKTLNEINKELINLYDDRIIVSKKVVDIPTLFSKPKGYLLYKGIGMDVDPQNKFIFPILNGDDNSYSISSKNGEIYSNGERIKLVNGYQTRNNRRVVISGSLELCSDKFYYLSSQNKEKNINETPNAIFCQDLLNWNFQRTGVLKFENARHNNDKKQTLETYRVKDYLEYYIDIYEFDYKSNSWKNYIADDIELTFLMLNPYYINQMKRLNANKPTYYAKFRAPEKHGVFKFIIDYHRVGYSYIYSTTKVPLRPFYHDEYPRFLPCAYPYYVSVFVVLGSFVLFSILFLYGKDKKVKEE